MARAIGGPTRPTMAAWWAPLTRAPGGRPSSQSRKRKFGFESPLCIPHHSALDRPPGCHATTGLEVRVRLGHWMAGSSGLGVVGRTAGDALADATAFAFAARAARLFPSSRSGERAEASILGLPFASEPSSRPHRSLRAGRHLRLVYQSAAEARVELHSPATRQLPLLRAVAWSSRPTTARSAAIRLRSPSHASSSSQSRRGCLARVRSQRTCSAAASPASAGRKLRKGLGPMAVRAAKLKVRRVLDPSVLGPRCARSHVPVRRTGRNDHRLG